MYGTDTLKGGLGKIRVIILQNAGLLALQAVVVVVVYIIVLVDGIVAVVVG